VNDRLPGLRIVERVELAAPFDCYFSLAGLAAYCSLSKRTLYAYLNDPSHPLPCYRVGGRVLVRKGAFDAWIEHYRAQGRVNVDQVVDGVLTALHTPRARRRARGLTSAEASVVSPATTRPKAVRKETD
jgi:excisionase family DNA binding protein